MGQKSPDAFRTISEVADWLDTPAHVLRFWESKFSQVKPVKRAGGRRYYRPGDMQLLGGIKKLLHDDGMTIKGAQKLLRENGIRYVCALSPPLEDELERLVAPKRPDKIPSPAERAAAAGAADEAGYAHDVTPDEAAAGGEVLPFASRGDQAGSSPPESGADATASAPATPTAPQTSSGEDAASEEAATEEAAPASEAMGDADGRLPSFLSKPMTGSTTDTDTETDAGTGTEPAASDAGASDTVETAAEAASEQDTPAAAPPMTAQPDDPPAEPQAETVAETVGETDGHLPGFLRKPLESAAEPAPPGADAQDTSNTGAMPDGEPAPAAAQASAPEPHAVPDDPPPDSLNTVPGLLSAIATTSPDPARADEIRPLLQQLAALRDRMAAGRRA